MKTAIVHLNCHTHPIALALSDVLSPSEYNIVKVINFKKELVSESLLKNCDIYIYHYLEGEHWGQYNSEYFLGMLPKKCVTIRYPILRFNAFWPFNTKRMFKTKLNKMVKSSFFPNGDLFLLSRLSEKMDPEELADEYINSDLNSIIDLDSEMQKMLQWFESPRNSKDINVSKFIFDNCTCGKLFHTVDHISDFFLNFMIENIFNILSLNKEKNYTCKFMTENNIPIHQSIIKKFDLSFVDENSRYLYNDELQTAKQYYTKYIVDLHSLNLC